jgi:hypothetical protein
MFAKKLDQGTNHCGRLCPAIGASLANVHPATRIKNNLRAHDRHPRP